MREDEHQPEEHEEPKATVLPASEAMSLISPGAAAPGIRPDTGQDDEAEAEKLEDNGSDDEPGEMLH